MASGLDLRLGIDVGGTHTDAVVLDRDNAVVAKTKQPTSSDVTTGVRAAIAAVVAHPAIDDQPDQPRDVGHHPCDQRRAGAPPPAHGRGATRRTPRPRSPCGPSSVGRTTSSLRSAATPRSSAAGSSTTVARSSRSTPRPRAPSSISVKGKVDAVAVSAVFSPMSADHELAAADIARDVLGPDVILSLSHEIGSLGLLPRENATILNSALSGVAREVASRPDDLAR